MQYESPVNPRASAEFLQAVIQETSYYLPPCCAILVGEYSRDFTDKEILKQLFLDHGCTITISDNKQGLSVYIKQASQHQYTITLQTSYDHVTYDVYLDDLLPFGRAAIMFYNAPIVRFKYGTQFMYVFALLFSLTMTNLFFKYQEKRSSQPQTYSLLLLSTLEHPPRFQRLARG